MAAAPIPTLLIQSSEIPGMVKLNDLFIGELGQNTDQMLTIPLSPTGVYYLSFIPLSDFEDHGNYCPVTRKLVFQDNKLIIPEHISMWSNMLIMEWPGNYYAVTLSPLIIPSPAPPPAISKVVDQLSFDFNGDGQSEIATLYTDGILRFVLEDLNTDRVVFDYTPKYAAHTGHLQLKTLGANQLPCILITGPAGESTEFMTIISYSNGKYQIIFDEFGHHIHLSEQTLGDIMILQRVHDTVQHGILTSYALNDREYKQSDCSNTWFQGQPRWPETPEDTVKALVEAIYLNAREEAQGYLSQSLQQSLDYHKLEDLLGDFPHWIEPLFSVPTIPSNEIHMGIITEVSSHYQKADIFAFNIIQEPSYQGNYKIHQLRRL